MHAELFVYGTLQPGASAHARLAPHVRAAAPACVRGDLRDLGDYPALLAGDRWVGGQLLTVVAAALAVTDAWEGYAPGAAGNLFERRWLEVFPLTDAGYAAPVPAWAYFFGDPQKILGFPKCSSVWCYDRELSVWRGRKPDPWQ